jgi:hypothetical protein
VDWRGVKVVNSKSAKKASQKLGIFCHVIPKEWTIFWISTVVQLHKVSPNNHFPSQVSLQF